MTSQIDSKPRYEVLDGLRGVGALMVVAFHLFETYSRGAHSQIVNHGYLAVDFFFVLSGYVIGYAYDDRWNRISTRDFFRRRLVRLHPMVILGGLLGLLFFYFSACPGFKLVAETPWWKAIAMFLLGCLMIPAPATWDIRGWAETYPLNGPCWTLMFEYLANIAYALVIRRLPRVVLAVFVVLTAIMTVDVGLELNLFGNLGAARTYGNYSFIGGWGIDSVQGYIGIVRLCYPFFCGLLLSRYGARLRMKGGFWWCAAAVIALLSMPRLGGMDRQWMNGLYESLCILVAFPLLVMVGAGSGTKAAWSTRICRFFGDISYPIYISHFSLIYMQIAWKQTHETAPLGQHVMVGVSVFFAAIALAYAALKLYDLPVRKRLSRPR